MKWKTESDKEMGVCKHARTVSPLICAQREDAHPLEGKHLLWPSPPHSSLSEGQKERKKVDGGEGRHHQTELSGQRQRNG